MENEDSALLARLNALKHSTVSFDAAKQPAAYEGPPGPQETPEDLIERFQKLYGRRNAEIQDDASAPATIEYEDEPPSPTIEELLADLGPGDQYSISDTDLQEANQLLVEAKHTLLVDPEAQGSEPKPFPNAGGNNSDRCTATSRQDQDEEAEAEVSLKRILDEVKQEQEQEPIPTATSSQHDATASVPSATLDSFASLEFPSVPEISVPSLSFPSAPAAASSTRKARAKPNEFSDEEIDSWCIICCADATVKCFGCDGVLYCWGCWREGHVGADVGLEEKSHVWYVCLGFFRCKISTRKPVIVQVQCFISWSIPCLWIMSTADVILFIRERVLRGKAGKA